MMAGMVGGAKGEVSLVISVVAVASMRVRPVEEGRPRSEKLEKIEGGWLVVTTAERLVLKEEMFMSCHVMSLYCPGE